MISRQGRLFDSEALSAVAEGVQIDLSSEDSAQASAQSLLEVLQDPANPHLVRVAAEFNEETENWQVVVRRLHHGNTRVSVFDKPFILSADYLALKRAGETFWG